jgi:hypothetical protein
MLVERYYYTSSAEGNLQEYVQDPNKLDVFHPFGNGVRRTPTKSRSYIEFLQNELKLNMTKDNVESTKYKFT